jgi:polyhydroxybutyrate depolymerase
MPVHGTADQIVKYEGKPGSYAAAPSTFDYWLKNNNLHNKKVSSRLVDKNRKGGTAVTFQEVSSQGVHVSLLTIKAGGHTWPGSDPFNVGYPLGSTTQDIELNEVLWAFFTRTSKQQNKQSQ